MRYARKQTTLVADPKLGSPPCYCSRGRGGSNGNVVGGLAVGWDDVLAMCACMPVLGALFFFFT